MLNLLKGEFRKILKSKSIIIMFVILTVTSFLIIAVEKLSAELVLSLGGAALGEETVEMPLDRIINNSIPLSSLTTVLIVFLSLWNVSDYSSGCIRNMLSRGASRESIYFAKYIVSMVITIVATLFITIMNLAFNAMFFKITGGFNLEAFSIYMMEIVITLAQATAFFGVIMFFQKVALGIIINLVASNVFTAIFTIVDLVRDTVTETESSFDFVDLSLSTVLTRVATGSFDTSIILKMNLISLGYIVVFLLIGFFGSRKKEY